MLSAVEGLKGLRPAPSAPLGREQDAWQAPEAAERDEAAQGEQFGLDVGEARQVIGEPDRAGEQGAGCHFDANAIRPLSEQHLLPIIDSGTHDDRARQTQQVDRVGVVGPTGLGLDGEHGRVERGPPEDRRTFSFGARGAG